MPTVEEVLQRHNMCLAVAHHAQVRARFAQEITVRRGMAHCASASAEGIPLTDHFVDREFLFFADGAEFNLADVAYF